MTPEHDTAHHRFVVHLDDGDAELTYSPAGEKLIDVQHTFVPPSGRGEGVADSLAQAAFDYARANGMKIIPSCPYVRTWLKRHAAEAELIARPSKG
jgi:predicted GNAT family acetyltransferase